MAINSLPTCFRLSIESDLPHAALLSEKDKDGALNAEEVSDLFSTTPGNPWNQSGFPGACVTNDDGAVTLQGFLAMWRCCIFSERSSKRSV
jgi:hypothetical protein